MMENRYIIALVLMTFAGVAVGVALADSIWLLPGAFPFAFAAFACLAPRSWSSNDKYRWGLNFGAYFSTIPAAMAMAAAVGVAIFLVVVLPALLTFVFVMWRVKPPAAE